MDGALSGAQVIPEVIKAIFILEDLIAVDTRVANDITKGVDARPNSTNSAVCQLIIMLLYRVLLIVLPV